MVLLSDVFNGEQIDGLIEAALKSLNNEKLSKIRDEEFIRLTDSEIEHFISQPKELFVDETDDTLYAIVNTEMELNGKTYNVGDKIECPYMSSTVHDIAGWISDYLPDIKYDILQGGNARRKLEMESIYTLCVLTTVVDTLKDEIKDIYSNNKYDFDNLCPVNLGDRCFRDLLNYYKEYNSVILNSIISACAYKISDFKLKKDPEISGFLTVEERIVCRNINEMMVEYVKECDDKLNKMSSACSKFERQSVLNDREIKIKAIFNSKGFDEYEQLFKLTRINSRWIPTVFDIKLKKHCMKEAKRIFDENVDTNIISKDDADFEKDVFRKLRNTGIRLKVREIKLREINKYRNDPSNYVCPVPKKV